VFGVHFVDGGRCHIRHWLAFRNHLGQLNLKRINAGYVVHDDTDSASVPRYTHLPFDVRKLVRQGGEFTRAAFEAISKVISTFAHLPFPLIWLVAIVKFRVWH
jgi:hypothetical protein